MNSNSILLVLGMVFLLFFIIHNHTVQPTATVTTSKSINVIHKNPNLHPYYNPYKNGFYI